MMYFVFNIKTEAEVKVAEISEAYFTTRPIGDWTTIKYCDVVECLEGWAVIADDFTSQFINGTPIEITTPEQNSPL